MEGPVAFKSFPKSLKRLTRKVSGQPAVVQTAKTRSACHGNGQPLPPVFAVGTGRSGTHFLHRLMNEDPCIVSHHLDTFGESDADSFAFYCLWNKLPVDLGGFLAGRQHQIDKAAKQGAVYFESNPYLALSVRQFFERFRAKFLHVVRNPEAVVNSHFVKGWYRETPVKTDLNRALGFQPGMRTNHFFGRIVPHGEEFVRWQKLTQVGRIAWMWNAINLETISQLRQLPDEHHLLLKIEEVDYSRYLQLYPFIGGGVPLAETKFLRIKEEQPGKGKGKRSTGSWSEQERQEFLSETSEARELLGYE